MVRRRGSFCAVVVLFSLAPLGGGTARAYPLDAIPRTVAPSGPVRCPDLPLRLYRGTALMYDRPLRIHDAFVAHMAAFENLVREVSIAHYGRAPRRIVTLGSYNCRRIRGYPDWISEHGMGNAVDIAGFDFGPARRGQTLPPGASPFHRHAFRVRMLEHWNDNSRRHAADRAFLRDLAQRVIDTPDLFRVILGPSWPGHRNHLHLDCSPYSVVSVF